MHTRSRSLARYYFHFAWMHACLSLTLIGLMSLYEWWSGDAVGSNLGSAVAVLIASAYFVAHKFVNREGRAPEGGEVHRLVWVSVGISAGWSSLFLLLTFLFVFWGELAFGLEVLLTQMTLAFWIVVVGGALMGLALSVVLLYLIYGRAARKVATRLQARTAG